MLRSCFLGVVLLTASLPLGAQVITTLTLTPGQNAITATASQTSGGPVSAGSPTAAGADVAQWAGTITVQLNDAFNPTSFTILSSQLTVQNGGPYVPDVGGVLGNAPGNYAFSFPLPVILTLAVREMQASLGGSPLALNGSAGSYAFSPAGSTLAATGRVDHRGAINGGWVNFLPPGSVPDVATASGSLTSNGSSLGLQFPLDTTISVALNDSGGASRGIVSFHLTGTLNATGAIPEPSTWALAALGTAGLALGVRRRRR